MKKPTLNQINAFCLNNPVLKVYLAWRENTNTVDRRWHEDITDSHESCYRRGMSRYTLRGNFLYGVVRKVMGIFLGIPDFDNYNYERDHLRFDFDGDIRYQVDLDVDGVWISARLPIHVVNEWGYKEALFVKQRLTGNVPFEKAAISPLIQRFHQRYFYPAGTVLHTIQERYKLNKADAVRKLIEARKELATIPRQSREDILGSRAAQRALIKRLKKHFNLKYDLLDELTERSFTELTRLGRRDRLTSIQKYDASWVFDFDGDCDEMESEFYDSLQEDTIYV